MAICDPPDDVANSMYSPVKDEYLAGETATYTCAEGYVLDTDDGRQNRSVLTCTNNGWTATFVGCISE